MPEVEQEPWDGFRDAFWTLGQVILWVAIRNPEDVDFASDRDGFFGENYASAAAATIIDDLPPDQVANSAEEIRRRCASGSLQATAQGLDIAPIEWTRLSIVFDDGMPFVRWRGQSDIAAAYRDLRFSRAQVLDEWPEPGVRKPPKGRKPEFDPEEAHLFVHREMDQRGDFDDPDQLDYWDCQARAEEALRDHLEKRSSRRPSVATVRRHVKAAAQDWRAKNKTPTQEG
jgi:hypothetical protein